jgi:hypothetical protein
MVSLGGMTSKMGKRKSFPSERLLDQTGRVASLSPQDTLKPAIYMNPVMSFITFTGCFPAFLRREGRIVAIYVNYSFM